MAEEVTIKVTIEVAINEEVLMVEMVAVVSKEATIRIIEGMR